LQFLEEVYLGKTMTMHRKN